MDTAEGTTANEKDSRHTAQRKPTRAQGQGEAETLATRSRGMQDSADRRTVLAADRTVLAAERTYAAWVRTGLAALASGVGAKKVLGGVLPEWGVVLTGSVLVLFSAACFAAAVWRELWPDINAPRPEVRRLPRAMLLCLNGFLMLVALTALFGVWFGETGGG